MIKEFFYTELYLIRFKPEKSLHPEKIYTDEKFRTEITKLRPTDSLWDTIESVLLIPQTKIGLGKPFRFTFTPICIEKHDVPELHDFKKMANDNEMN